MMHHCTDRSGAWVYEKKPLDEVVPTLNVLCLAGLGSIPEAKRAEAEALVDEVELLDIDSILPSGEPFNCRTWLKMAVDKTDRARVIRLISDVVVRKANQAQTNKMFKPTVYDRA